MCNKITPETSRLADAPPAKARRESAGDPEPDARTPPGRAATRHARAHEPRALLGFTHKTLVYQQLRSPNSTALSPQVSRTRGPRRCAFSRVSAWSRLSPSRGVDAGTENWKTVTKRATPDKVTLRLRARVRVRASARARARARVKAGLGSGSVKRVTLSLLRARNRGHYVGLSHNVLRESRNRHVMGLLRARNRFRIGFVTTWHVMGT